ncbi:MAG: hypothetical protein LDLANPLL_00443 [Turneriella sp.]|nr:hypothetical protein [Turneriella sp.]
MGSNFLYTEQKDVNRAIAELRSELAAQNMRIAHQNELLAELQLSRTQKTLRLMRTKKRLIAATLFCFVGIPLLHAAVPHTFTAGTAAVAADVNANFTKLDNSLVPIGGIIAWHKSMTGGTPSLPATGEWVECNGQTLGTVGSAYDGQVIPNLNGAAGGADSPGQSAKVAMFLRGGVTSGTGQQDAFQGHHHVLNSRAYGGAIAGYGGNSSTTTQTADSDPSYFNVGDPKSDGTNGTPRTSSETRPVNMSVVWIMRVK